MGNRQIELFCENCEEYVLHSWHTDETIAECLTCFYLNPVDVDYEREKIEEEEK